MATALPSDLQGQQVIQYTDGMPIVPGVYEDMPNEVYHSGPGISNTGLGRVNKSPATYMYLLTNEQKETPALRWGKVMHAAVLEPHLIGTQYILGPNVTSKNVKAWKDFVKAHPEQSVYTPEEFEKLENMVVALQNNELANTLLYGMDGVNEVSFFWHDQPTYELCKCRPDRRVWLNGREYLVDLKTCENASADKWQRHAWDYRYHVQAAFNLDGAEYATGCRPQGFIFVAIEKEPPHLVACYLADAGFIAKGAEQYRKDLDTYAKCRQTGEWLGYEPKLHTLCPPNWVR